MVIPNGSSDIDFASNTSCLSLENINSNSAPKSENNMTDGGVNNSIVGKSHGSAKCSQNCSSCDSHSQNSAGSSYEDGNNHDTNDNMDDSTKNGIEEHITNGTNNPQHTVRNESSQAANATPHGSVGTVKNLYKSKLDSEKAWTWVDKYPEDATEAAENEETAKYAVIVRNTKSQDSRKKLEAHSIIIQSPWLKEALDRYILNDYPGVTCALPRLEFESPFKPFVHRWAELLKFMKRTDIGQKTKEHITLLHDIVKREISDYIEAFQGYFSKQVITFDHLWMLYQPGGLVVSDHEEVKAAFEFQSSEYLKSDRGRSLRLNCECIDWSGKYFGRRHVNIDIDEFHGTKEIQLLRAFPLRFHKAKEVIKMELIKRGGKFESLCGYQYKAYSGFAITWDSQGREVAVHVSGRIIIDAYAFNCFSPYSIRPVGHMNDKDGNMLSDYKYKQDLANQSDDIEEDVKKRPPHSDEAPWLKLTPYHQMLCTDRVRGYSLKLKMWLDFFVDSVSNITWNTNAFDHLILPEDQKELILGFAESQVQSHDTFDDVIQGKGRGVIILLSGPPGIGKTLTAEAVAENMQVPLHTISSGDLGSAAGQVESRLSNILELVARWNAILLLDECDVFLEKRSPQDLDRNRIVSIFLRTLEYYEGILFMTTNCPENIDTAFQSRIHVSMQYPDLTMTSRRQIWRNFLERSSQSAGFSKEDIDYLASVQLNGRQIKNTLKTAMLLATRKKMALNKAHVDAVLAIEQRKPNT